MVKVQHFTDFLVVEARTNFPEAFVLAKQCQDNENHQFIKRQLFNVFVDVQFFTDPIKSSSSNRLNADFVVSLPCILDLLYFKVGGKDHPNLYYKGGFSL